MFGPRFCEGEEYKLHRFRFARAGKASIALAILAALSAVQMASAHTTVPVGEGAYLVIIGFAKEPAYTEERNGLDLIIRRADDGEPVPHLEGTLFASIATPGGEFVRELPLRAQHGQPGRYTADFVLTRQGVYTIRVWGLIHDVEVDVEVTSHEVSPLSSIRFPD